MPLKTATTIFVRGLAIEAQVGIYHHERGRSQPLVIDAELLVAVGSGGHLADTFNYETVRKEAQALAASGHFELVETFARQLGETLMADPRVERARIRIEKTMALAPDAKGAGVELVLERA